jgi:hypothetical protein
MRVLLWYGVLREVAVFEVGGIVKERGVGRSRRDVVVWPQRGGKLRRRVWGILPNHSHGGGAARGALGRG